MVVIHSNGSKLFSFPVIDHRMLPARQGIVKDNRAEPVKIFDFFLQNSHNES